MPNLYYVKDSLATEVGIEPTSTVLETDALPLSYTALNLLVEVYDTRVNDRMFIISSINNRVCKLSGA